MSNPFHSNYQTSKKNNQLSLVQDSTPPTKVTRKAIITVYNTWCIHVSYYRFDELRTYIMHQVDTSEKWDRESIMEHFCDQFSERYGRFGRTWVYENVWLVHSIYVYSDGSSEHVLPGNTPHFSE